MTYYITQNGTPIETDYPLDTYTKVSKREFTEALEKMARDSLKKLLKPNTIVYTVLREVSKSGMTRHIDMYVIKKNKPVYISGYAAMVMGYSRPDNGIKVQGCGMDMGFHLVYTLGARLWPNGTRNPHGTRNGEPDHSGGYALKHEWI